MRKRYTKKDALLGLICLFLACAVWCITRSAGVARDQLYDEKLAAAQTMAQCMAAIKRYKLELGLPISSEDTHGTGMIGESYSEITTTLGAIEAKRTSANPDMAALMVELLYEAGVRTGGTVGASFSGSFPSLNLAVLSACKTMGVECRFISSVGASTFGANQPELTFPDMAYRLAAEGLLPEQAAAFTIGGAGDIGGEMEPVAIEKIAERVKAYGIPLLYEPDYQKNLTARRAVFEGAGAIDCFISAGGNVTSLGRGESSFYLGQGLLRGKAAPINEESGLVEIYYSEGTPTINLLNLKRLCTDYGLAYDPVVLPLAGASALYYQRSYARWAAGLCLLAGGTGLIYYRKLLRPPANRGSAL